jgi:hypothetical protein
VIEAFNTIEAPSLNIGVSAWTVRTTPFTLIISSLSICSSVNSASGRVTTASVCKQDVEFAVIVLNRLSDF